MNPTPEIIDLSRALQSELTSLHRGAANGLTCRQLADRFACSERDIRHAVEHLRMQGQPVGSAPKHGYFWCDTQADLEATFGFLKARALRTLIQMSCITKKSVPEIFGQLQLEITDPQHNVSAPTGTGAA